MKPVVLIGIILIGLGLVSVVYQGVTYTSEETVLDIGPITATAETQDTIPLPPILGGLALVAGTVMVVTGLKKG